MFAAMSRLVVLILGVVWASLLLISWSGGSEAPDQPGTTASLEDRQI